MTCVGCANDRLQPNAQKRVDKLRDIRGSGGASAKTPSLISVKLHFFFFFAIKVRYGRTLSALSTPPRLASLLAGLIPPSSLVDERDHEHIHMHGRLSAEGKSGLSLAGFSEKYW